ncbi:MAG: leucine-rich repeat protein [Bacteroidetes bacterium]|nr:leucine-rich repeat protein [Bacteroidota bacterium]
MIKKLFLFTALCLFAIMQMQAQTWNIGHPNAEDVTATFNSATGTLTVSGIGNMQNFPPWYEQRENIRNVIIEQGVTSIGNWAFWGTIITEIIIPESVTRIGFLAFANTGLTEVTIPESITSIGDATFNNTPLTVVNFNAMNFAPNYSWSGQSIFPYSVKTVNIGDKVVVIPNGIFSGTSIMEITIPENVRYIGLYAFGHTLTIVNFNAINAICFNINNLGRFFPASVETINIGDKVETIADYAFWHTSITEIAIPNSVTSIGNSAFANTALTSVSIPESITSIRNSTFANTSLTEITIPETVTTIGGGAFANAPLTTVISKNTFPPNLGNNVFSGINPNVARLYVPAGTRDLYLMRWHDFRNIIEMGYIVSVTQNAGGTVLIDNEAVASKTVMSGGNVTITITADSGYAINQVLVNGVNNETAVSTGSFTLENITANHTISVAFRSLLVDELEKQLAEAKALIEELQRQLAECLNDTSAGTQHINSVQLHPNPAQNFVYIQAEFWIERIEIFNTSGVRVFAEKNPTNRIDLRGFVESVYFVRIYGTGGMAVTKKLIVR